MAKNLYDRFSELTGERFVGFDLHSDEAINRAYNAARLRFSTSVGDKASLQLRELDTIFQTIGTEQGRHEYAALHMDNVLPSIKGAAEASTPSALATRARALGQGVSERFQGSMARLRGLLPKGTSKIPESIAAVDAPAEPIAMMPVAEDGVGSMMEIYERDLASGHYPDGTMQVVDDTVAPVVDAGKAVTEATTSGKLPVAERMRATIEDIRAAGSRTIDAAKGRIALTQAGRGLGEPLADGAGLARGAALIPTSDPHRLVLTSAEVPQAKPLGIPFALRPVAAPVAPIAQPVPTQSLAETAAVEEAVVKPKIGARLRDVLGNAHAAASDTVDGIRAKGGDTLAKLRGRLTRNPALAQAAELDIETPAIAVTSQATASAARKPVTARPAAEPAAPLHTPAEKAAIVEQVNAQMRPGTMPAQRTAEELAAIKAHVRAASKPKGKPLANAWAALRNRAEGLIQPAADRFSSNDPYKIIGIKPGSAPEDVMIAYNAKLAKLSEKPLNSPTAQRAMVRLQEAYENIYPTLITGEADTVVKTAAKSASAAKPIVSSGRRLTSSLRSTGSTFEHGGKLLVGGVIAAGVASYLANRKPPEQETPILVRADGQRWADAVQPSAQDQLQR
jgi:ElaB/YqjD/DUF883 family membrane-anchored ribosome-binding protein